MGPDARGRGGARVADRLVDREQPAAGAAGPPVRIVPARQCTAHMACARPVATAPRNFRGAGIAFVKLRGERVFSGFEPCSDPVTASTLRAAQSPLFAGPTGLV